MPGLSEFAAPQDFERGCSNACNVTPCGESAGGSWRLWQSGERITLQGRPLRCSIGAGASAMSRHAQHLKQSGLDRVAPIPAEWERRNLESCRLNQIAEDGTMQRLIVVIEEEADAVGRRGQRLS